MGTIDYHKNELKIALDVNNQNRILPELSEDDKVILDIGCGIGQSFIALNCTEGRKCIWIDIDKDLKFLIYRIEEPTSYKDIPRVCVSPKLDWLLKQMVENWNLMFLL